MTMHGQGDLPKLFPESAAMAAVNAPVVEQEEYLVDGRLERWGGPFQEVRSPVGVRRDGQLVEQIVRGRKSTSLSTDFIF